MSARSSLAASLTNEVPPIILEFDRLRLNCNHKKLRKYNHDNSPKYILFSLYPSISRAMSSNSPLRFPRKILKRALFVDVAFEWSSNSFRRHVEIDVGALQARGIGHCFLVPGRNWFRRKTIAASQHLISVTSRSHQSTFRDESNLITRLSHSWIHSLQHSLRSQQGGPAA